MNILDPLQKKWEIELRLLVQKKIKEQVVINVQDPTYLSIWIRRPHNFIDSETNKLLEECWRLMRIWRPSYEATHSGTRLSETWGGLSIEKKEAVALHFKTFFYEKGGYYLKK